MWLRLFGVDSRFKNSMIFLEKFFLPTENKRVYPYRILNSKMMDVISFSPVTVFYGSNGSGKSTLLNVIAEKN